MTKYLGFLLMLIAFANLHAQQTVVRGTVKDFATGETLPFVSVFFKDTKIGVTTDINGKYELKTYYATDTLVVVFVGYARKAI